MPWRKPMVTLVLTAEQAKVLADAREPVELIDGGGTRLGIVARPPSASEVEKALARLGDGREGRTTVEVLARLITLQGP
jgi:hypothetical protein